MKRDVHSAAAIVGWLALAAIGSAQDAVPGPIGDTTSITANRPQATESDEAKSDAESTPGIEPGRSEGLWPSNKLLRLLLTRFVDGACDRYDLDDDQREAVRDTTVDRWAELLTARRSELKPLVNEFLEMRLGLEPPDAEQVKAWSDRAAAEFDAVREQIEDTWDVFGDVMTPGQRARFELETLAARAALDIAAHKLGQWREGLFDASDVWKPREQAAQRRAREARNERRAERRERAIAEAKAAAGDQVDEELSRWEKHVAVFIERYGLNDGQRTTALSLLAEVNARASAHRDRHGTEIAALERRIEDPNGDESDRESIKKELMRLYGPIDELFAELERRLEPIPTGAQRVSAGRVEESKENPSIHPTDDVSKSSAVVPATKQVNAPSEPDGRN